MLCLSKSGTFLMGLLDTIDKRKINLKQRPTGEVFGLMIMAEDDGTSIVTTIK